VAKVQAKFEDEWAARQRDFLIGYDSIRAGKIVSVAHGMARFQAAYVKAGDEDRLICNEYKTESA
jgi:hypothetical protein